MSTRRNDDGDHFYKLAWLAGQTPLGLGASAKAVLVAICAHANKSEGYACWAATDTLATESDTSFNTVRRTLPKLAEIGAITVTPRGNRSDLITVHFDWLQARYEEHRAAVDAEREARNEARANPARVPTVGTQDDRATNPSRHPPGPHRGDPGPQMDAVGSPNGCRGVPTVGTERVERDLERVEERVASLRSAPAGAGHAARSGAAVKLPEGWRPSAEAVRFLEEAGLDLEATLEGFIDLCRSEGLRRANWHSAFMSWVHREAMSMPIAFGVAAVTARRAAEGDLEEARRLWNEMADRIPSGFVCRAERLPAYRVEALTKILRDHGLETWRHAMSKIAASDYLTGRDGKRHMRLSIDDVTKPKEFDRIISGWHANRPVRGIGLPTGARGIDAALSRIGFRHDDAGDDAQPVEATVVVEEPRRKWTTDSLRDHLGDAYEGLLAKAVTTWRIDRAKAERMLARSADDIRGPVTATSLAAEITEIPF